MSQGGEIDSKDSVFSIPFALHSPSFSFIDKLATYDLELPSDAGEKNLPKLCFDIRGTNERHSLNLMKTLVHPNILHIWALLEWKKESCVAAYVDNFTGALYDLLTEHPSEIDFATSENVVPSMIIQDIVSQMADGLDFMRLNGCYHGNLSLETTLYHKSSSGYTIKLCNFVERGSMDILDCQRYDWVSLGYTVEEISHITKLGPRSHLDFCLLDDLCERLKTFSFMSLETVRRELREHPFFWDSCERKFFFVSKIPTALDNSNLEAKFRKIPISLPWNSDNHDGYLLDMAAYRTKKGYTPYDVTDEIHYIQCISGMYTHEKELQALRGTTVDQAVQRLRPHLCLGLYNAMR